VTEPGATTPFWSVRVNLSVLAFSPSLNEAPIVLSTWRPVVPSTGEVEVTVGGVVLVTFGWKIASTQ